MQRIPMMAPQRSIQPNGSPAHDSPSDVPQNEASYTLWSDRNRAGSHNNSYRLCLTMKIVCEGRLTGTRRMKRSS